MGRKDIYIYIYEISERINREENEKQNRGYENGQTEKDKRYMKNTRQKQKFKFTTIQGMRIILTNYFQM